MRGAVVRAVIAVLVMLAAAAFLIDWPAIVWQLNRFGTDDAQLRGNAVRLAASVPGYVAAVAVTDYQAVHKGDLLYRIEADDYRARVAEAQAQVAAARAGITVAQARIASQQAHVAEAQATAQATAATLEQARLARIRQAALLGTESGLPRAFEAAEAQERRLAAQLAGQQDAIGAARAQVATQRAQVDLARATLDQRIAALHQAEIDLGYTLITAPEDGVVGERLAFEGQYLAAGAQVITLVPLNPIWAVANYREDQVRGMRAGEPATVRVDAFPGVVLHGRVQSFEPTSQAAGSPTPPDRAVGSFTAIAQRVPVKITLDPGHPLRGRLLPGLSVGTVIDTGAAPRTRANP